MTQTAKERLQEIGQTISQAMGKLTDVDWSRESPAAREALDAMHQAIIQYGEGAISKAEVKQVYKRYVDAHRGGLL